MCPSGLATALAVVVASVVGCSTTSGWREGPHAPVDGAAVDAASSSIHDVPQVRSLRKRDWVEVSTQVVASDDEAPAQARERALDQARIAAVEHVAGVRIKSGVLSFEQVRGQEASSLVQILSSVRADALVVEERVVSVRTSDLPGDGYRLRLVMQAKILDRGRASDSGFSTEIRLPRERFLDGEEVRLSVRTSHDARVYVIGITEDGAAVILPNRLLPDNAIEAGEWMHFPSADLEEIGVRLVASVPEGKRSATEALFVVALRGGHRLTELSPAHGERYHAVEAGGAGRLLDEILSPLGDLPQDDWTFDQIAYEVWAR